MWSVFSLYYSYETTISMNIGYSTLPLPSITICNINPMRYSLLSEDEIEDEDHILPLVSWKSRDMVSLLRMLLY